MEVLSHKPIGYRFDQRISTKLAILQKLDNYHVVLALLEDFLVIASSILIAETIPYFYPIAIFFIGARQRGLATIMHDAAHGVAAKNKTLNLMCGTIFSGFLLFQSLLKYKNSHVIKHHGFLGNENHDPDFQFYIKNGLYDPDLSKKKFFLNHVILTFLLFRTIGYIVYLVKNRIFSTKENKLESILMLLFWGIVLLIANINNSTGIILFYWIIPYFTTYLIIGYFIEIAEHYPLLGKSNEIIKLSRNRFSHWVEGLFFSIHNENFHLVHHLRPKIPFWNMVIAHNIMMEDKGYREFNKNFGGIFVSNNGVISLIIDLCGLTKFGEIS